MAARLYAGLESLSLIIDTPYDSIRTSDVRDDLIGVKVWYSTTSGFNPPSQGILAYDGSGLNITINGPLADATQKLAKNTTYYVKYALISSIEPEVIDVSAQLTATTTEGVSLLTLDTTDWAFIFKDSLATTPENPASITFTAVKQNLTGTPTFTAIAYNSSNVSLGNVTLTGTGDVRVLTAANFNALGPTTVRYVKVTVTLGTLSDVTTIFRGDNGSDALTFILTNESHTVPAANDGFVTSYSGAVTYGAIFRGITNETNLWTITKTDSTGLTTTLQGTSAGVNNITVTATALTSAVDSGTCTITATRTNYPTLSKVFSISKSKAGAKGDQGDKGDPGNPGSTGLQGIRSITAYRVRNQTDSPLTTAPSDTSGATAPTDYSLTASSVTVGQVLWYSFGRYNPNASAVEGIPANTTVWSIPIAASIFQDIRSDNWDGYNPANGLTPNNPSTWGTTGYYIDRTNGNIYSTGFYARGSAIFDGSTSTAFAVTTAVRANNTGTADIGVLGLTSNTSGFWGLVGILSNPGGFAGIEGRSLITSKPGIWARNSNNGGTALKIEGWLDWNSYLISPPDGTNTKYLRADGTWATVSTSSLPSGGTTGQFLRGDGTWSNTLQGSLLVTGEVTAYSGSDIALKQDIVRIPNALEKVLSLGGYNFTWTDKHLQSLGSLPENYIKRDDVGIIAQQVLGVLPQAVVTRDDGILAVNYTKLIPLIIEAIIELHKKVSK